MPLIGKKTAKLYLPSTFQTSDIRDPEPQN